MAPARTASVFILIAAFYLVLSGQFHVAWLVITGLLTAAGIAFYLHRQEIRLLDWSAAQLVQLALVYTPWLLWQIAIANWRVLKIVLDPARPIEPCLVRVPCPLKTPLGRALYANSITLTPGTVTVRVEETEILVHALTAEDAKGLEQGDMLARIQQLEGQA